MLGLGFSNLESDRRPAANDGDAVLTSDSVRSVVLHTLCKPAATGVWCVRAILTK